MNRIYTIFIVSIVLSGACKPKQKKDPAPTVLEGKKVDVAVIYKKGDRDLVEALYNELVQQSDELKDLEEEIHQLRNNWPDSIEHFKRFDGKNSMYYDAATRKAALITDSVLRKKLLALINTSQRNYRDSIAHFTLLDSLLKKQSATLNDLHQLLKITRTLPLIEEFQKKHLPDSTSALHASQDLDALLLKLDSLTTLKKDSTQK